VKHWEFGLQSQLASRAVHEYQDWDRNGRQLDICCVTKGIHIQPSERNLRLRLLSSGL
jgi:hypothetical protein